MVGLLRDGALRHRRTAAAGKAGGGGGGDGQLNTPIGVAVDAKHVYVACYNPHRIAVFARDGTYVRSIGSEGAADGQLTNPRAVAVAVADARVRGSTA